MDGPQPEAMLLRRVAARGARAAAGRCAHRSCPARLCASSAARRVERPQDHAAAAARTELERELEHVKEQLELVNELVAAQLQQQDRAHRPPPVDVATMQPDQLLKKRNKKFFTESLRRVVEVLSLEEGAVPVGSFKHLAFLYPGDIDLFEGLFFPFTDRATAATRARHRIAVMARRIELESHRGRMFFADFKAGYDERLFFLSNAEMSGGPDDVDLEAFLARLQTAVETELVSDDRARPARTLARRMARATCDVTRRHDWTELLEATRKLYTLRWTLPELIAGRKRLPRGTAEEGQERVVTLEEALQSKSVVKIDVWALLQDELGYSKFAEVTNFWNFQYRDAQTGTIRSMTKE